MTAHIQPTAISILHDGTAIAANLILQHQGIDPDTVDADKLAAALKTELTKRLPEIMDEWKAALDAHSGEAFMRSMMNVQCNHTALMTLKAGGWL